VHSDKNLIYCIILEEVQKEYDVEYKDPLTSIPTSPSHQSSHFHNKTSYGGVPSILAVEEMPINDTQEDYMTTYGTEKMPLCSTE
jgi:hypothetical protein